MLPDYSDLTPATVTDLVDVALEEADRLVAAAVAGPRTYEGTMAPLDRVHVVTSDAYGRGAFMARVHPDAAVREAATATQERLAKWGADLLFRDDLAAAIREYATTEEASRLGGLRRRNLEFWLRDLRRAGHELDPEARAELQRIQRRLVELQVAFERNLGEWEDHIQVTDEDLDGLPDAYRERLRPGDRVGTRRVTMDYPDYVPFMQEARRRDLRRELQFRFWNRAAKENTELLAEAVALRRDAARILGKRTWAEHAMEVKMADPEAVEELYARILPPLTAKGREELAEMHRLLQVDHPGEALQPWDWMYYDTLQAKHLGVDPNEVAAYFPLERVVAGMFEITGEVFGLQYRKVDEARAWHSDVELYEIVDRDRGEPIAAFYVDLFPREGKFSHAACFPVVLGGFEEEGRRRRPVAAIVANFTRPTEEEPSLLKHSEALTLFHEFGHVLHFCLTEVDHPRFAGYDTEWDFVEAPSQIMENWMWEPDVLARFARHHRTGEPIPGDLVERLVRLRDLNVGLKTLRQIFLGKLDLALHGREEPAAPDEAYRETYPLTLLPFHEGTHFPASFGHLMGGYDAGYYGYLWSRVYGDDMFSAFEAEGVLSPEVGRRYRREILARGASRDAVEHLRAFLGREPSPDAFLRRLGIA